MLAARKFSPHTSTVNTATRHWLLSTRFAWRSSKALRRQSAEKMPVPVPIARFLIQSPFSRGWKVSGAVPFGEPVAGARYQDGYKYVGGVVASFQHDVARSSARGTKERRQRLLYFSKAGLPLLSPSHDGAMRAHPGRSVAECRSHVDDHRPGSPSSSCRKISSAHRVSRTGRNLQRPGLLQDPPAALPSGRLSKRDAGCATAGDLPTERVLADVRQTLFPAASNRWKRAASAVRAMVSPIRMPERPGTRKTTGLSSAVRAWT